MAPDRKSESHHYVPQFYLRHWCAADGKMWVYPVEDGSVGFRASPKNFAAETGLYNSADVPTFSAYDFEARFSQIEGLFDSCWPEVFDSIADPKTKANIARFLALMHIRHPRHKVEVRKTNAELRRMAAHAKAQGYAEFEVIDANGQAAILRVCDVEQLVGDNSAATKAGFLNALTSVESLAQILSARKWGVVFNPSETPVFLTSDRPLILHPGTSGRETFGFATSGTEITFPITPTKLLRISDAFEKDGLHYPLIALGNVNEQVVLTATRFVFTLAELNEFEDAEAARK
jgi:hypothetical protein